MKLPNRIASILTVTLVTGALSVNIASAQTNEVKEEILLGKERCETAIKISQKGWLSANEAVVVNESSIADAISATPFADAKNAPVLLTQKDKLDDRTKSELKRLGVKKVYVIGGKKVLSENVEKQLKEAGINIDRIQGETREKTALEIAKRLDSIKAINEIAVVNGYDGLADAVSVAGAAANKDMAIILTNSNTITKDSDEFINGKNIKTSYVIGGKNVISKEVEAKLPNAKRIEGINRHETNSKVIETFYAEKELKNAYVTKDGMGKEDQLIDALSVGVLAAKNDSPVIIVGKKLNQMQKDVTNTKTFKTVTQVGGNGNEAAFNELKTMQGVTTYNVTTVEELNKALEKADANDVINMNNKHNEEITIKTNKVLDINLSGDYKQTIVISAPNAKIVNKGTIAKLVLKDSKGANIENTKSATIANVEVASNAGAVNIVNKGTITTIKNDSKETTIDNTGGSIKNPIQGTEKPHVEGNIPPSTGGGSSNGGGGSRPPQDKTEPKLLKSNISERAVVLEFDENINSNVSELSKEIKVILNDQNDQLENIENTAYIKDKKLVILFNKSLEANSVIKINANAIKDNSNNKNKEITINYENSETIELENIEFKKDLNINQYGELVDPTKVLDATHVNTDIYKLKGSLKDNFSVLSDKIYYDESGVEVNPGIANFEPAYDQIIYIETEEESSGYDKDKDIALGRFELYAYKDKDCTSVNGNIVNAEYDYAKNYHKLNSLKIPKNPGGFISVYIVKPEVNPLIQSGHDPKTMLTKGEIILKPHLINIAPILNFTNIKTLTYENKTIDKSIINDNYGILNSIVLGKNTNEKVSVTVKKIDIVSYINKEGSSVTQNIFDNKKDNSRFVNSGNLKQEFQSNDQNITLDNIDINIKEFVNWFNKGDLGVVIDENGYIKIELTLDVKIGEKTETEILELIWKPLSTNLK